MLEASESGRKEKHLVKVCVYADKGLTVTKVTSHGGDIHSHQEAVEKIAEADEQLGSLQTAGRGWANRAL